MSMKKLIILPFLVFVLLGAGCSKAPTPTPEPNPNEELEAQLQQNETQDMNKETLAFPGILPDEQVTNKIVRVKTSKGEIIFELLPNQGPKAASNFVYLANKKFYDGLTFHRVVPGFVIQGGDPSGNGTGGPGYQFEDDQVNLPYTTGIVAMANAGPNTNGSQFFIMLADNPMPPNYSVFGRVLSGQEIVDQIAVGDVMSEVTVEEMETK